MMMFLRLRGYLKFKPIHKTKFRARTILPAHRLGAFFFLSQLSYVKPIGKTKFRGHTILSQLRAHAFFSDYVKNATRKETVFQPFLIFRDELATGATLSRFPELPTSGPALWNGL